MRNVNLLRTNVAGLCEKSHADHLLESSSAVHRRGPVKVLRLSNNQHRFLSTFAEASARQSGEKRDFKGAFSYIPSNDKSK